MQLCFLLVKKSAQWQSGRDEPKPPTAWYLVGAWICHPWKAQLPFLFLLLLVGEPEKKSQAAGGVASSVGATLRNPMQSAYVSLCVRVCGLVGWAATFAHVCVDWGWSGWGMAEIGWEGNAAAVEPRSVRSKRDPGPEAPGA